MRRVAIAICASALIAITGGCQQKREASPSASPPSNAGANGGGVYAGAPNVPAPSTGTQSQAPSSGPFAEGYRAIDPKQTSCGFEDVNYRSTVQGNYTVPIGGSVGKFYCQKSGFARKYISLARPTFEDGFIATKNFGDVQVLFTNSINSDGFIIGMKQSDVEKLSTWLTEK